jgi:PTS system mannose-specific IID component
MQSLGFAFAIEPVLRKLYPDQAEYEARLRIHLEYFNTQPYLASFILGAVVRMEEDRAAGRKVSEDVTGLKSALMAPLGALGDTFFWGALKPFASVVTVALLMTGHWWAPLLFLVFYNICHVGLRASMLFWGYQSGGDAMPLMARHSLMSTSKRLKRMTLAVLGGVIGMVPDWSMEFKPDVSMSTITLIPPVWLVVTLVLVAILRLGGSPIKLMLGLAVLCIALAYAGVIG